MKIYTYYTESHRIFFEQYFKKTVQDLEIVESLGDQECQTGSYYQDGWKNTTMKKVDVFIRAVQENMNGIFVFSDVDIQFFGPIEKALLEELGEADIAIQNDYNGGLCSGFFICRGNERTLRMFENMKNNHDSYLEDQHALNMNLHFCKVNILSQRFWTFGSFGGQWKGQNFQIPDNLLMHHANWTEGIQNKINLLNIVRQKYILKDIVQKNDNDYQFFLNEYFEEFRPLPTYPVYPPYHTGKYIEGFFFDFFNSIKNSIQTDRVYLPIDWTTSYLQNANLPLLQEKILSLDLSKKYFTVCQHDDGVKEYLPKDTLVFNVGGKFGGISIPPVCSPIPDHLKKNNQKDIFCSFVGSITHPIRKTMIDYLSSNSKYLLMYKNWTPNINSNEMNNFIDYTERSHFTLCPRGYSKTSFRMFECMQLESIPVYIWDDEDWRPFKDDIDWSEFSVVVHVSQLSVLDKILSSITEDKRSEMQKKAKQAYYEHFSLEAMSKKIINKIKNK